MSARTRPRERQRSHITAETLEQSAFADGVIASHARLGVSSPRTSPVGLPTALRTLPPMPGDLLGSPAMVIHNAVAAATRSIDLIEEHIPLVAEDIRWRGLAAGGAGFDRIIEHAKRLVLLAALAAQMSGEDLKALGRRDARIDRTIARTCAALDRLLAAQDAGDALGIAETLAGPLAEALDGWRDIFGVIAGEVRYAA